MNDCKTNIILDCITELYIVIKFFITVEMYRLERNEKKKDNFNYIYRIMLNK